MKIKLALLALVIGVIAPAFATDTGWVYQPRYTQGTSNPSVTATAGSKGDLYFNTANNGVWVKQDQYPTTNWNTVVPVNGVTPFFTTCTITSAAAATAVHCLPAANVGTAQVPYLTGFHAKVNGSTVWATTATCAVQDTNGTPVNFWTEAVAGMTANAYITDTEANITLGAAYSLGTGGTAGKGLDVKCNANGTGSDFVVTLVGYLK